MNREWQAVADAIERDRTLRARRMSAEQRLLQGPELFDSACEASLAGLRAQLSDASADELHRRVRQRVRRARALEGRAPVTSATAIASRMIRTICTAGRHNTARVRRSTPFEPASRRSRERISLTPSRRLSLEPLPRSCC